ncbi:UNVERIFIED_CONTAM: hypothetical protein FKN15_071361 [Acipenser sinensis]
MHKLTFVLHLLDDYLLIDIPDAAPAKAISTLKATSSFGVPLSGEKTLGPSTCLEFLGITLDSVAMETRLTQEKLDPLRILISKFQRAPKGICYLYGYLNYTIRIIHPGRAFISRLRDIAKSVSD